MPSRRFGVVYHGAMKTDSAGLARFRLEGVLGEGADVQAFAATDVETGKAVVVKRPHPALLSRSQHGDIERDLARGIELRMRLGNSPHVPRLIAHTGPERHDRYFGDELDDAYTVVVEERARGVPLMGSAVDGIKQRPIALPHNLFALHPVVPHARARRHVVALALLDAAEALHHAGVVLLDIVPQKVYFDPGHATNTIIYSGGAADQRQAAGRHNAVDPHDFYLELFKWYATPTPPPADVNGYLTPHEVLSVPTFDRTLDALEDVFGAASDSESRDSGRAMLDRVRKRGYSDTQTFRRDFQRYLAWLDSRYDSMAGDCPGIDAWRRAFGILRDD